DSARDIKTWQQYNDVLKAFANLGFKVKAGKSAQTGLKKTAPQTGRSGDWISARQEYYIRGLWDMASRAKDEASLQAMLQRIAGVKYIQWISKDNATKVILALRDIAKKAGYNPDAPAKAGMKEK
ncbi:phage protein GemA/Gp16 family protein, partial [Treponema sp. OMZ 805]|uniref:phage protein GemA/Gp16 family protein n=1 Tax=Treponema sp. OMZ 805 TaxID=2726068 RepID=UPI003D9291E5